jgi:hypothetical protein
MEHGDHTHGFKLFNEELHVPLLLKAPKALRLQGRFDSTVSTVDIFPTVLELTHIQTPSALPGISLLDEKRLEERFGVMSEIRRRYSQKSLTTRDGRKMILEVPLDEDSENSAISAKRWQEPALVGMFDRHIDDEETAPLADSSSYGEYREQFDKIYKEALSHRIGQSAEVSDVSDDTLDQLKSLGYLK